MISKAVEVMPPLSLIREQPSRRPEFLTWVLDDASEQDAAAVLVEIPPPARLVYRRVLRPATTSSIGGNSPV